MNENITPFNTGKILIGSAYVRDTRPELTASEELIQAALLSRRNRRSVGAISSGLVSAVICAAAFIVAFYVAGTVFASLRSAAAVGNAIAGEGRNFESQSTQAKEKK